MPKFDALALFDKTICQRVKRAVTKWNVLYNVFVTEWHVYLPSFVTTLTAELMMSHKGQEKTGGYRQNVSCFSCSLWLNKNEALQIRDSRRSRCCSQSVTTTVSMPRARPSFFNSAAWCPTPSAKWCVGPSIDQRRRNVRTSGLKSP